VWSQTDKRLLCTENVTPKRQNIAKEIHETEVSYLNGLVQVIEVCISHPGLLAVFCFVSIPATSRVTNEAGCCYHEILHMYHAALFVALPNHFIKGTGADAYPKGISLDHPPNPRVNLSSCVIPDIP
jgi:hypothetical protein